MEWLAWLIVGGVTGLFAHSVMYSRMGLVADIINGILGGLAGGFVFSLIGQPSITGFNLWGVFAAFMGAMIVLRLVGTVLGNYLSLTRSPVASLADALQETEGLISTRKRDA
jgi:uncharacterized membrane protein YeaQ/YmgE (transglycosylase-associated protein family)